MANIVVLPVVYVDGQVLTASDLNSNFNTLNAATIPVTNGGTGLAAGTSGGVLYFSSTTAIGSSGALTQYGVVYGGGAGAAPSATAALTNGQVLIGSTGAAPVPASLSAGAGITITPGAGTLSIASSVTAITSSSQDVTTSETTTSTSYTDLATSGPAVTLSPGSATTQLIIVSATVSSSGAGDTDSMSVAIAGAGAADVDAGRATSPAGSYPFVVEKSTRATSVASGATHTAKYKVSGGTGTFANRRIIAHTL